MYLHDQLFLSCFMSEAGREDYVQSYEQGSFFSVFSPLGPFSQVFRQVKQ